ncbi:MAG: hypothetical protein NG740_01005 [Omnitrophica bacterium]|nr:hypothetical protein [Candidatus Omnitrophota bacterium]
MVAGFSPTDEGNEVVCTFCGEEFKKKDLIKLDDGEWGCQNCIEEGASIIKQVIAQRRDGRAANQDRTKPKNEENGKSLKEKTQGKPSLKRLQELVRWRHMVTLMKQFIEGQSDKMNKLVLYIVLWLIIVITAYSFLIPKYYFTTNYGVPYYRCNRVTGVIENVLDEADEADDARDKAEEPKLLWFKNLFRRNK